jgi:NADH-quinone oxidoreductase subunit G
MSEELVTLTIEGIPVTVPAGTLIVDAAKKAGIDIPVFCYHPKMEPVGMCRMCLVQIGRPRRDRATGQVVRGDDGQPLIDVNPNLETACTTPVGDGWAVSGLTEKVRAGRREVLEFLLSSHPLDCPICDKGGECPLQNLTMAHGPGKSRFAYEDKIRLAKHVPLGELIFLDRERCIQCARCTRFQDEVVGEPVIGFHERGRKLEIVTFSEPGFDSVFSGNTTDICPVGALTTADFRFEARPWELNAAASICTHCPVGCNLTLNTRRQPNARGEITVQRVMPRQNESVNEIWICDKGRFGQAFAASRDRLTTPLVRQGGRLVEATWDEALTRAAEGLANAGDRVVGIAGGRASNEDLFNFHQLMAGLGGTALLDETMAGGDMAQWVGAGSRFNLGAFGAGDAIAVLATDLYEEAPLWWLRVKQAADRGAALIVANARSTKLDAHATHALHHPPGRGAHFALALLQAVTGDRRLRPYRAEAEVREAAKALQAAREMAVLFGGEGLDAEGSQVVAQAMASLLVATRHAGRPGSGLIPVWPRANSQGAWDIGWRPAETGLARSLAGASAIYVMAADPLGSDPNLAPVFLAAGFSVVQELFLSETAQAADVVFPVQAFTERDGTFTSGERRVQRFFPALPARPACRPDWQIVADVGRRLGMNLQAGSTGEVTQALARCVPDYASVDYPAMARVEPQWPLIGGEGLYFGGTAYRNQQGLGVKLAPAAERGLEIEVAWTEPSETRSATLLLVPVHRLYDRGTTLMPSGVLDARREAPYVALGARQAARLGVGPGDHVCVEWHDSTARLPVRVVASLADGMALIPRSVGLPLQGPAPARLRTG